MRCLGLLMLVFALMLVPVTAYATDSDGDGLTDADEGTGDADGDGIANYLDLDSDNDGYSDLLEGGFDGYEALTVSTEFRALVDAALSGGTSKVGASFMHGAYRNQLVLSAASAVSVTFMKENTTQRNSVGYYAYPAGTFHGLDKEDVDTDNTGVVSVEEISNVPGVEIGWLFPNASKLDSAGGVLQEGDTYTIGNGRVFPVGTKIGFFLLRGGWVGDGTLLQPYNNGYFPYVHYTSDFLNYGATASDNVNSDSSLNSSRQVALMFTDQNRNQIVMGFEDIERRWSYRLNRSVSDEDYEDLVFTISTSVASAFSSSPIAIADIDGVDADGDGVADADELVGDTDGDGTQNVDDPDDDGDGIVSSAEGANDADGDGIANYLDTDSDADGVTDSFEGAVDTDADGIADYLDTDRDNDGVSDAAEQLIDNDGDGILDWIEGKGSIDTDGDGVADNLDTDSDNDGISDAVEGSSDADGDTTANYRDLDSDNDGYTDALEGGYDRYDPVTVPTSFTDIVDAVLTEGSNVGEAFINPAYKNDLVLSEPSELRVTFIKEGAGNRNAVGYYVFPNGAFDGLTKGDVDADASGIVSVQELNAIAGVEVGWVFPNGSKLDNNGGILVQGDSYILGNGQVFPAGSKVGFFLVADGWANDGSGTILEPYNNGTLPRVMFTTDFLNPTAEASADLSTDSSTNLSRQVALLYSGQDRSEIIMGFEDIWRKLRNNGTVVGDQDFNDAVFSVSSTTASALATVGIATADVDGVDADGDGVLDVNEQAGDSDGDGTPDVDDPDDDGDGIVTTTEGTDDADGDSTANYLDTDSDNDGISDSVEGSVDTDADGIADYLDTDSDNDGLLDSQEAGLDSDNDGTLNRVDVDDDGDSIATVEEGTNDTDSDGTADYLDTDSDNDTVSDGDEAAGDTDGDGVIDRNDTDDDGDGILTVDEGSADSDGDGTSDHIDLDSDNDGLTDEFEGQVDSDGDGLADRVDSDDDNDGIPTAQESTTDPDGDGLADYLDTDSDNDGVEDGAAARGTSVELTATTRALQSNYTGEPLVSGDQIEYTITITNTSGDAASTVEVEGLVPVNTTYVDGTFTVDGSPVVVALDSATTVDLGTLAGNQGTVLTLTVAVDQSLPSGLNKISSVVSVDSVESASVAISDNDASGHCGIVDDGSDSALDAGSDTSDDDPTNLPLMQGTFAESCTLAFEDLQNAGWCDWDMNDIVLAVTSYYVVDGSNHIESMVVTYQLLARGAGFESKLNLTLPFSGDAQWQRLYLDLDGEIEESTLGSDTDSATIVLWESSEDALPPFTDLQYEWGPTRTEWFDPTEPGKRAVVNVYFDSSASNPLDTFSESPHDTWAWIPATQQAIHRLMYNSASSQIVYEGPLYGRTLPFVAKFDIDFVWPHETIAIWESHPEYVDFIKSGGTTNQDWANSYNTWMVWWDDQGIMNGGDVNPSASSIYYINYVETWSSQ